MPRDSDALVNDLSSALEIPVEDARLYVASLIEGRHAPKDSRERDIAEALVARGMMIRDVDDRSYLPVHPRLALSNLFRAYEERLLSQRKERRLLVDKLTLQLIPLSEAKSKRTNPRAPEGETAKR